MIIDCPVEEVWKFMTDWSNFPKMNPAILEARQTSAGPVGVGTTVEARLRNPNMIQKDTTIRVIGYEPNQRIVLEHTSGTLKGTITTFGMETSEGKTRLTIGTDAKLGGFLRIFGPFAAGRAKREVSAEIGNVKRILESTKQ